MYSCEWGNCCGKEYQGNQKPGPQRQGSPQAIRVSCPLRSSRYLIPLGLPIAGGVCLQERFRLLVILWAPWVQRDVSALQLPASGQGIWNDADPKMQAGQMAQHLRMLATQSWEPELRSQHPRMTNQASWKCLPLAVRDTLFRLLHVPTGVYTDTNRHTYK